MINENLEIKYGDVFDKFKNHLNLEHNRHILFSGKFGIGKSTFLRNFFKNNKEFYTITITPVNYVVSTNENIFELIKVDIIKQLYEDEHIDFSEELKVDKISAGFSYILNKPLEFTKHITNALSKLHPILEVASQGSKGIHELIKSFSEYENDLNEKFKSKEQILLKHEENFHSVSGTYLEFDLISIILKETLKKINKETILIIDDLDRLDPEHIFRLLNIFSAHNNHISNEHKFGFKKIILVADIQNIEKLYEHRYGSDSEFDGYIDKFYSDEIFNFSNNDALIFFLKQEFKTNLRIHEHNVLVSLLETFVKYDKLNLRNIIKYRNISIPTSFPIDKTEIKNLRTIGIPYVNGDILWFDSDDVQILYVISILSSFFGSIKKLSDALTALKDIIDLIEKEFITDYFNAFVIIHRYLSIVNKDTKKQYFTIETQGNRDHYIINEYLKGIFLNIEYQIEYTWTAKNRYMGNVSFFNKARIFVNQENIDENKMIKRSIINELKQIISFIEKQKLNSKLNIVS